MARLRTLLDLRNDAYQMADLQNAVARFPVSEVNGYVNDGVGHYYDQLVRARGTGYFERNTTIITDGVNTSYALPADFYELVLAQVNLGFTVSANADVCLALSQFNMYERPELASYTPGWSGQPFLYRVHGGDPNGTNYSSTINVGTAIEFLPKPAPGMKVTIFYVPVCPVLVNDSDTIDTINGWDRYATAWAALLMRTKEDLPVDTLMMIVKEMRDRIQGLAAHRDTTATRVVDVRSRFPGRGWRRQRIA